MSTKEKMSARIPMADEGALNAEQHKVLNKIIGGKRGNLVGPFRALLHSSELADRTQQLGEFVRYDSSLPAAISELAILCTARYWNCPQEWAIHVGFAEAAGVDPELINAISRASVPAFQEPLQIVVYEYCRELLAFGGLSDAVYQHAQDILGDKSLVELTGLIGYYTMLAFSLNAHQVPLDDRAALLPELGADSDRRSPTRLPPAIERAQD
jgi:4-carboxymuconolactone decarboxylase